VLAKLPESKFIFALMAGEPHVEKWIQELKIDQAVKLLPPLSHDQMADIFRQAQIVASPSIHDGTPNSLLEGIACGCFPVAGDLESIREWIRPEENGLLFDANDEKSIASAIVSAIENAPLREQAADFNRAMIAERAEYKQNMKRAEQFYEGILSKQIYS
jgi:glycosyltransferase involved in cell wall biosynthesis